MKGLNVTPYHGGLSSAPCPLRCPYPVTTRPPRPPRRPFAVAACSPHAPHPTQQDHQPSTSAPSTPPSPPITTAPRWSRRAALLCVPFLSGALLPTGGWGVLGLLPAAAVAPPLRSLGWTVPSELTVLNELDRQLKIYWVNYDGDAELFGSVSPGSVFTVNTYESHAWRFVDGSNGATLAEHVVEAGPQLVRVASKTGAAASASTAQPTPSTTPQAPQSQTTQPAPTLSNRATDGVATGPQPAPQQQPTATPASEELSAPSAPEPPQPLSSSPSGTVATTFDGFDGLGNAEQQYSLAQLREVIIYPGGGDVLLALPGSEQPLEVGLAGPEALSLVAATGSLEQRRPSTLGTWSRSLMASGVELRRVCITRMVDGLFYCRIVLSRPDASLCSLDATPGDSLSLALQLGRPIYVANEVVRVHKSVLDVFSRRRAAMEAAAASGLLDEAAEAEADRQAQDALDSITAGIPAAPRLPRGLDLEQPLSA